MLTHYCDSCGAEVYSRVHFGPDREVTAECEDLDFVIKWRPKLISSSSSGHAIGLRSPADFPGVLCNKCLIERLLKARFRRGGPISAFTLDGKEYEFVFDKEKGCSEEVVKA